MSIAHRDHADARALVRAFVRALASGDFSAANRTTLAAADWPATLRIVDVVLHPWLLHRARETGVESSIPGPERHVLEAALRESAMRELTRRAAFIDAMRALRGAGIECTVLKGMALAHTVYPAPHLRTMADIDLWAHGCRLERGIEALAPLGWHVPWWRDSGREKAGTGNDVALRLRETAVMLELHRCPGSLAEFAPGEADGMWNRRVRATICGVECSVLSAEDMLLHLSVHAAGHHRFVGTLRALVDVGCVLAKQARRLDWPALAARSRAVGAHALVATTLGAAADAVGAHVSEGDLGRFGVSTLARLRELAAGQAWLSTATAASPWSALATPSIAGRLRRVSAALRAVLLAGANANSRAAITGGGATRLFRRLRLLVTRNVPAYSRALWARDGHRRAGNGAAGAARYEELLAGLAVAKDDGAAGALDNSSEPRA